MTIDQALNRLHIALYDDFDTTGVEDQMNIIRILDELVEKLKLSIS